MNHLFSTANNDLSFAQAQSTARDAAVRALEERGVDRAGEYVDKSDPITVLGWCKWWDGQKNVGPGLLVARITSGAKPPTEQKSSLSEERTYGEQIHDWLRKWFPDLCRVNPEIVELERKVHGDEFADRMAAYSDPHYSAVAAVTRLHQRFGKGSLTVGEHGAEIRAAVEAEDREQIEYLRGKINGGSNG